LGVRLGLTPMSLLDRVVAAIGDLGITTRVDHLDSAHLEAAMRADKKRLGGRNRFVIPAERGVHVVAVDAVDAIGALVSTGTSDG
jgi:3-dehydroquinate synthetase